MQAQHLLDQLAGHVRHGDHLCVIAESPDQRLAIAAQYAFDGLRRNEIVMYAADAQTTDALRSALTARGIDVADEERRGALRLPTAGEAYLRDGTFRPDVVYSAFEDAIAGALAAGFTGCRFAGEPVWALDREALRPGLIEFESRLNGLFRSRKAAGLCVYDRGAWPASVIRDVLRTHPVAVVGDLVCARNLYFERPDLMDDAVSADAQVRWMLAQLRELRTQEARLEVALDAGRLGSWELDVRADRAVRSLRHDRIFGYDRLLPSWGFDMFMEHVVPEDRDAVAAAFRRALDEGTTWRFECRIRRAGDGALRWIEAHGRPHPEGARGERVERLLGIVADVTERKELEQALREADRRKDEFLATLAHELRNPLAPIVSAVDLLGVEASPTSVARARAVIERQARHLARLVDDLMDVARISRGHINLQTTSLDLRETIGAAVEAAQPLLDAGGVALAVHVPAAPLVVSGDATRLTQTFLNLLHNAAKFTPRGGHVTLDARRDGGDVVVRLRDDGIGIRPELVDSVFEMFVQGHRTGERAQGGLGIGLSLARKLIEMHGGSILATSDGPGRGSEFVVRLPSSDVASPAAEAVGGGLAAAAHGSTAAGEAARRRVLVVDDNVDAADCLAESLQLRGHEVSTCYDATSASAAAERLRPDVAILDIGLPDADGYTLARRLRGALPDVVLVALTGWGQEKDRRLAREAGFDEHRTKPVDPDELVAIVEASLTRVPPARR